MKKSRTIISGAKATPNDNSQLRDVRTRDCADHLCAIFGDTAFLRFRAYHVTGDVYKKEQRDRALRAELDEMGRLERRRREKDAVIRDNANGETVDVCEPLRGISMNTHNAWREGGKCDPASQLERRVQRTVTMVCPYSFLNSRNRLPSTTRAITSRMSNG